MAAHTGWHLQRICLLPLILLLLHFSRVSGLNYDGYLCNATGKCVACQSSEMAEDYCKETGYKETLVCIVQDLANTTDAWNNSSFYLYRSCTKTKEKSALDVLAFEGVVLGILAVSVFLMIRRKAMHTKAKLASDNQ